MFTQGRCNSGCASPRVIPASTVSIAAISYAATFTLCVTHAECLAVNLPDGFHGAEDRVLGRGRVARRPEAVRSIRLLTRLDFFGMPLREFRLTP